MKNHQWYSLWSMLCAILGRIEHIDGHPNLALFIGMISFISLIFAAVHIYKESKKSEPQIYRVSLTQRTFNSIADSFERLEKSGDDITLHESNGDKLIIKKII